MLAHVPDAKDAARIPILDISSKTPSPKARSPMNKDMVNPIPHSQAAPKSAPHEISGGVLASRDNVDIRAKSQSEINSPTRVNRCSTFSALFFVQFLHRFSAP